MRSAKKKIASSGVGFSPLRGIAAYFACITGSGFAIAMSMAIWI
jgi:hypothetical protein